MRAHPLAFALLLGLGFVVGELLNSFVKRHLDIRPGTQRRSPLGIALSIFDQADFVPGVWLTLSPLWTMRTFSPSTRSTKAQVGRTASATGAAPFARSTRRSAGKRQAQRTTATSVPRPPEQPDQHIATDPHLRLSLDFFNLCKTAAAPFDERVQLELARRGACMAIDLYRLLTLKQFALQKAQRRAPELLSWDDLAALLGHGNKRRSHLRETVASALQMVGALYPSCNTEVRHGGLLVRPRAPHIPPK